MSWSPPGVGFAPANDTLVAPGEVAASGDGSYVGCKSSEEEITLAAAAYTDSAASLLPGDAWIVGVVTRVLDAMGNTFDLGIAGDTAKFLTASSGAAGAVGNSLKEAVPQAPYTNQTASALRITHNAGDAGKRIRVVVKYFDLSEPTA